MTNPLALSGGMARIIHPHIAVLVVDPTTGAISRSPWRWSERHDYYAARDAGLVTEVDHCTYERHARPHVRADCFNKPELVIGAKEVYRMTMTLDGLHRRTLFYIFERKECVEAAWADLQRMDRAADVLLARLERTAAVLPH